MFILVQYEDEWYILQSYARRYMLHINPLDMELFRNDLLNIANTSTWYKYFHIHEEHIADVHMEIWGKKSIYIGEIPDAVLSLEEKLKYMQESTDSYIHSDEYAYILL